MASKYVRILYGVQIYHCLQHFTLVPITTELHEKRMYVWRVPCIRNALYATASLFPDLCLYTVFLSSMLIGQKGKPFIASMALRLNTCFRATQVSKCLSSVIVGTVLHIMETAEWLCCDTECYLNLRNLSGIIEYIHVYGVRVCVCVCVLCVCMYVYMYVYIYIYIYYTHICYVCMCIYVSLSLSLSLCIYIYIYIHTYIHTHRYVNNYMNICICIRTYIYIYIYIYSIHTYIHTYIHKYIHIGVHQYDRT